MTSLRITVDGRSRVFPASASVVIGRAEAADIRFDDRRISRRHVEVRFDGSGWVATDYSSGGTWVDGERIQVADLDGTATIRLGPEGAPELHVEIVADEHDRVRPPRPVVRSVAGSDDDGTISLDDQTLRLDLDGVHRVWAPGSRVVVGRDAECEMRTTNRLVSGRHCVFTFDHLGWWIEDLGSTRGTFIDHRRITARTRVEGAFFVQLGDDDAGEPLRVVTAGEHRVPVDRKPFFLAVAAVAMVLFGLAGVVIATGDAETATTPASRVADTTTSTSPRRSPGVANTTEELAAARLGTVRVGILDESGFEVAHGSGSLVDSRGTILTNAHVAFPNTYDTRTGFPDPFPFDPELFEVRFASVDGGKADVVFFARPLELHPSHDVALIRIVSDADGELPTGFPAAPLPFGSSAELRAGDQVAVVGYPGQAFTDRVSVAVTNFQSFAGCGPVVADWRCQRDYEFGWLNLANESLGGGSSGGPIVRNGRIVGVQQGLILGATTGDISDQEQAVPIDVALDGLEAISA